MSAALSLPAACGRCADCEVADLARAFVAARRAVLAFYPGRPSSYDDWTDKDRAAFRPLSVALCAAERALVAAAEVQP